METNPSVVERTRRLVAAWPRRTLRGVRRFGCTPLRSPPPNIARQLLLLGDASSAATISTFLMRMVVVALPTLIDQLVRRR